MGGYREGDMPRMGLSVPFTYHLALVCKRCRKEKSLRSGNIRSKLTEFVVSLDRIVTVTPTLSLRRTLGNLKEHLKSERSTSLRTVLKNFNMSCTWGVFFYSFA